VRVCENRCKQLVVLSDLGLVQENVERVLFPVLQESLNYFCHVIKVIFLERYIHFYSDFLIKASLLGLVTV
jgi:hypothetical protein